MNNNYCSQKQVETGGCLALRENMSHICLRAEALQHSKACLHAIAGTSACEGMLKFSLARSW
jgi:hypothetical protein